MPRATIMLAAALLLMAAGGREVTNNPPRRDRAGAQGAPSSVERQEGRVAKPLGVPRQSKDCESLPSQAQPKSGGAVIKQLPDGSTAVLRNFNSDGRPTLEIQHGGGQTTKIRCGGHE
jgi:hypothetical protein